MSSKRVGSCECCVCCAARALHRGSAWLFRPPATPPPCMGVPWLVAGGPGSVRLVC